MQDVRSRVWYCFTPPISTLIADKMTGNDDLTLPKGMLNFSALSLSLLLEAMFGVVGFLAQQH